jgi:hypothetical protein
MITNANKRKVQVYKTLSISFRYSNIFAFRALCKHCGKGASRAYFVMNKDLSFENFLTLLNRKPLQGESMIRDGLLMRDLAKARSLKLSLFSDRDTVSNGSVFLPNSKPEPAVNEISCRIECECGKTCWQFSNSKRKHIYGRTPKKFLPFDKKARLI